MARYINIDKVKPDCISTKGGVAVSQSQLANQPTADVVEREKINKAIEKIVFLRQHKAKYITENYKICIDSGEVLKILQECIGE